ncbi:Ca2+-modulated nonselective cation channel polycystin [Marssonina coronariae]|uniref:Ca2+-modulated nonselective cation channel polycystin n=1 Tax=Diplocarpon coronariae TaxID=2795749 RepID=A0A218Z113_9HELO|nr:Ca2+-modulated nonselective cation channel polycystin [Marssonina coronariae]
MKTSPIARRSVVLLSGLSTLVAAKYPLATVYPCPSCPSGVAPPAITVTEQYQTVSTCAPTPYKLVGNTTQEAEPSCSSYAWVSTVIPAPDGSSTTVTKTEQEVQVGYVSTVLTSKYPCATSAPSYNATGYGSSNSSCTSTRLTTMVVDTVIPYNELGPLAIGGYAGSGLCETCEMDEDGAQYQVVTVHKCLDGACTTYAETLVSAKPTAPSSVQTAIYSSSTFCPSSGAYTIPVTTTCSPEAPEFTDVVTKTFYITTSVSGPETIQITKTITVTFTGAPEPTAPSSKLPVSTSAYVTENGVQTVPIYATITPSDSGYEPVTTTAFYTTSVTNAPVHVYCTKTLTVTFTSTAYLLTVVDGVTKSPEAYPTEPAPVYASVSSGGYAGYPSEPAEGYPGDSSKTPAGYETEYKTEPASYPTDPAEVYPADSSKVSSGYETEYKTEYETEPPAYPTDPAEVYPADSSKVSSGYETEYKTEYETEPPAYPTDPAEAYPADSSKVSSGYETEPPAYPTDPAEVYPADSSKVSSGYETEPPAYPTDPAEAYPADSTKVSAGYPTDPVYSTKSSAGYPTKPVPVLPTYTPGGTPHATYGYGNNTLVTSKSSASYITTTAAPSSYPSTPASCEYSGCYGSPSGFSDFTMVETSGYMSASLCTSECIASGFPFSGLYKESCYCSKSIDSCIESGGVCDAICPGSSQHCGGDLNGAKYGEHKLFDIYECTVPTSTTSSSDSTASYTIEPTPDPSSDVDEYPSAEEYSKRSLQADMQLAAIASRDVKLRRGGMLRSREKKETSNLIVKRDFGIRRPFGL